MKPLRRRDAAHLHGLNYGPNMTPMVDVVMVILIFYMSVASFAGSEWFLKTALPRPAAGAGSSSASPVPPDPFALEAARFELTLVRVEGQTMVRGQGFEGVGLGALAARLKALAAGTGEGDLVLVIRSGAEVPYGDVIRAHDAATAAGIVRIGLMDAP